MDGKTKSRVIVLALFGLSLVDSVAGLSCSQHSGNASGVDDSHAVVLRGVSGEAPAPRMPPALVNVLGQGTTPMVTVSQPFRSRALRDLPAAEMSEPHPALVPGRNPFPFPVYDGPDPVLQSAAPRLSMPATLQNFLGQGTTLGGCIFPKPDGGEPAGCTTIGDPPDTEGAAGPNHYMQVVNGGIAVWNKSGSLLATPVYTSSLWAGYPQTDGNHCSFTLAQGGDNGDGVVLYDQLADRWFVAQLDVVNYINSMSGPSYECVAVSQTGDPLGAYWLYDFQYSVAINDYGKFSAWPDAYYASFNEFDPFFVDARVCAYDRAAMLQGQPATQQCFTDSNFGFLPGNLDGAIKPPNGEPAFFVRLGTTGNSIALYKFHVDWTTPGNSTFTGPTTLAVSPFNQLCNGGNCVPVPSPGNQLASLGDRPMFHLSYRNFGTLESLVFNHSVATGGVGGIRWYEIRSPNGTPSVFQQGTYAPSDGKWRWMGSLSQDQAQDIALGFSISSSTTFPSIGWTGRLASDPAGTMGQGESVVQAGAGVEIGNFSNGQPANRWGDYSNMTVDPTDDCTFWYTQELYPSNGTFNWDTRIASVKFPGCAQNDFSIGLSPASQNLQQGLTANYTVTTAVTTGSAETIALTVQDLPTGVTGALVPTSITAGQSATLTLTAAAAAPLGTGTFMVIGKAPSAVHAATAQVTVVVPCMPLTMCPAPDNCGTIPDGCGGMVTCGPPCTAPQTCGGGGTPNVCGCTPLTTCPAPDNCGMIPDGCGGMVICGSCSSPQTCGGGGTPNVCGCTPITVCPAPYNCGTYPDGCGASISCGPACTAPQTCGGGGMMNVCGCTPLTMCPPPDNCGTISDGCGGTLTCGTCSPSQTCTNNQCVNNPPDAGTDSGMGSDSGGGDSGMGSDSGMGGDTGTTADSGGVRDSGSGVDSGPRPDSGMIARDSGSVDTGSPSGDAAGEGGAAGGSGDTGGCGCRIVPSRQPPSSSPIAFASLALVGALRMRRRRKRSSTLG